MILKINQKVQVIATYSQRMIVRTVNGEYFNSRIKGKNLRPVCGDWVLIESIKNENEKLITKISLRNNELSRINTRGKREVLAANINLLIIVIAVHPEPDWYVVDRYISTAENMGIKAAIVFNKIDLDEKNNKTIGFIQDYKKIGYQTIKCSVKKNSNLDKICQIVRNKTAILVGQSGVGKSSIINKTTNNILKISEISAVSGQGKHTTANSMMFDLPNKGKLIDSPGIRDFITYAESFSEIISGYKEIKLCGVDCKFHNCRHLREPDCAVKYAVLKGKITNHRYNSYKRLINILKNLKKIN